MTFIMSLVGLVIMAGAAFAFFVALNIETQSVSNRGEVTVYESRVKEKKIWSVSAVIGFLVGFVVAVGAFYWGPQYDVWQQGMAGRAELTRAEQNRQIRIEEAKAEFESAKMKAQAEIERAKGAAEANKIMAESLGGPDRYLRWRWITMLESNEKTGINREIIYVPADGSMPMSEAGRAVMRNEKTE